MTKRKTPTIMIVRDIDSFDLALAKSAGTKKNLAEKTGLSYSSFTHLASQGVKRSTAAIIAGKMNSDINELFIKKA